MRDNIYFRYSSKWDITPQVKYMNLQEIIREAGLRFDMAHEQRIRVGQTRLKLKRDPIISGNMRVEDYPLQN